MKKEWTHKISVSEPWNYEGDDGQNLILGKIIEILDKDALIFESKNELEFCNNQGNYLLLHPRYEKQTLQKDFRAGISSTVNVRLLSGFREDKNNEDLEIRSKFIIIGSLEVNE